MVYLGPKRTGIDIRELELHLETGIGTLYLDVHCDDAHLHVRIPISKRDYDRVIAAKDAVVEAARIYGEA